METRDQKDNADDEAVKPGADRPGSSNDKQQEDEAAGEFIDTPENLPGDVRPEDRNDRNKPRGETL